MPTPNVIKYSASPVSNTIGRNNMRLGISDSAGYGPTSSTDFWNGYTPGASGYTIYVNKVSNGPSIFSPANDTELINTAKYIATSINLSPTITTAVEAISWINSQSNMICVNYNYPSIVTSGLVALLDASFTTSYSKGGTGWRDLSDTQSTATLINGVSYLTNNNGSLSYSSSSLQYVELPDLGNLNNFTVSCWFKLSTLPTTSGAAAVVTNVYNGSNLNFSVGLNNSPFSSNICGGFFNGAWRTTSGFTPATGSWYSVDVTYDGSQIVQYLNGAQQSTLTYSGTAQSSGLGIRIGRRWDSSPNSVDFINGEIPFVSIYNRALSSSEILSNYNSIKSRYPPDPVSSNLVLYYDPSNSSSYSGSGTTINDLSGNGLSGTLSNITYTSPAFNFNGTNSTISVADNALLEPGSSDWSMEAWVNHSVITGSSRIIFSKTDGGLSADWGYGLRTNSVGSTFGEIGNGTTSLQSSSSTLSINTWYQVVAVWTNVATNSFELYINGVIQGSRSHSFTSVKNTTNPLYIGSFNNGQFSQWLNGKVGIIRIYNSALTSAQVLQNYNANKSKYGL